ncbi:MAG: patatin-like phospholipase family protein [Pseudomonadota bacterium]
MTEIDPGRRRALKALLAGSLLPTLGSAGAWAASDEGTGEGPRIGLALGSGGARGVAHVLVFELLEELGLRPHQIAGTSIGAIMGSLYASSMSASQVRDVMEQLILDDEDNNWFENLFNGSWTHWIDFIEPFGGKGGLLRSKAFVEHLAKATGVNAFEELKIPLKVVATDYWDRSPAVFEAGPLWPAIQASMAMPGLFHPVAHDGRVLVDGGLTNPVPYDLLLDDCDLVIAVNVLGTRQPDDDGEMDTPSYFDNSFNTFQIMQFSILQEKLRHRPPDFLVTPKIHGVRVMEFNRYEDILEQSRPAIESLREDLKARLAGG